MVAAEGFGADDGDAPVAQVFEPLDGDSVGTRDHRRPHRLRRRAGHAATAVQREQARGALPGLQLDIVTGIGDDEIDALFARGGVELRVVERSPEAALDVRRHWRPLADRHLVAQIAEHADAHRRWVVAGLRRRQHRQCEQRHANPQHPLLLATRSRPVIGTIRPCSRNRETALRYRQRARENPD